MFHCVFGPLLVHLCALYVPVQLYENYDDDDDDDVEFVANFMEDTVMKMHLPLYAYIN